MSEQKQRRLPPLSSNSGSKGTTEDELESPRRPRRKKKVVRSQENGGEKKRNKSRSSSGRREQNEATMGDREVPPPPPENDEDENTPRPKPKKRKQKMGTSKETLVVGSDAEAPTSEGESTNAPPGGTTLKKKKKKKKKKPKVTSEDDGDDYAYGMDVAAIQDDIVDNQNQEEDENSEIPTSGLGVPAMRSEPTSRIFIERKSGFKTKDKVKLAKTMAERQIRAMEIPEEVETKDTTIQFGLATHKIFRTVCLFIQGLLAGFALWHVVTVWVILSYSGTTGFLSVYQVLALPVQCLYYILLVICTVSAFDRYDLARPNRRFVKRAFTLQNGAIATLFYFLALVFSTAIAATDDKIGLYDTQPILWSDIEATKQELLTWRIVSLLRGAFAILGWLVVSLKPSTDRLTKNLERADDKIYEGQQQTMANLQSNGV